jgi:hypothetical protein
MATKPKKSFHEMTMKEIADLPVELVGDELPQTKKIRAAQAKAAAERAECEHAFRTSEPPPPPKRLSEFLSWSEPRNLPAVMAYRSQLAELEDQRGATVAELEALTTQYEADRKNLASEAAVWLVDGKKPTGTKRDEITLTRRYHEAKERLEILLDGYDRAAVELERRFRADLANQIRDVWSRRRAFRAERATIIREQLVALLDTLDALRAEEAAAWVTNGGDAHPGPASGSAPLIATKAASASSGPPNAAAP